MKLGLDKEQLTKQVNQLKKYKLFLFIGLVIIVYAFIALRGSQLSRATPKQSTKASQSASLSYPHIDPATIQKINQLQDNSVNVQSLFDQARQNPFHE